MTKSKNYSVEKNPTATITASIIFLLGLLYTVLLVPLFTPGVDPANEHGLQYLLHVSISLTIVAYFFFIYALYRAEKGNEFLKLSLLFAGLSLIPILIGRCLGIAALSYNEMQPVLHILNFYGEIPVTRTIELIGWTIFFPISLSFLARSYSSKVGRSNKVIGGLALASALCCFVGIGIFFTSSMIPLIIGIMGWGMLFLVMIAAFLYKQMRARF